MNSPTTWDPFLTGQMRRPPGPAWQRWARSAVRRRVPDLRRPLASPFSRGARDASPNPAHYRCRAGRSLQRPVGIGKLEPRQSETEVRGLEEDAGVNHVRDRDVDRGPVIHLDRVHEAAGREELAGEGAPRSRKSTRTFEPVPVTLAISQSPSTLASPLRTSTVRYIIFLVLVE